jgi:DNA modification methylase
MSPLDDKFVNQILNYEAIDGMRMLPYECIPLTVTSPPFDDLRRFGGFRWDFDVFREMAEQLWRITVSGGVVVWVVADTIVDGSETCTSARQKLHFKEIGFRVHHTMIMDKAGQRFPSRVRYGTSLEYAFILSKGKPRTVTLLRDRPNKKLKATQNFSRREYAGGLRRVGRSKPVTEYGYRRAIWQYPTGWKLSTQDDYAFDHPALMHEDMAKDHIRSWSLPGELIFDPMAGAATTCKMALLENRRYLGFEIHEPYFQLAQRRMRDAHAVYNTGLDSWLIGA